MLHGAAEVGPGLPQQAADLHEGRDGHGREVDTDREGGGRELDVEGEELERWGGPRELRRLHVEVEEQPRDALREAVGQVLPMPCTPSSASREISMDGGVTGRWAEARLAAPTMIVGGTVHHSRRPTYWHDRQDEAAPFR